MSLLNELKIKGRFPPVEMRITPLVPQTANPRSLPKTVVIDKFINYQFNSSVLVPVDNFSYSFTAPDESKTFLDFVLEGDIVTLYANNTLISTGIVDQIEIECDGDTGEKVTVNGRNLLGQLEDQNAVDIDNKPINNENMLLIPGIQRLLETTRIKSDIIDNDAPKSKILVRTVAGESKLSAILRILEPLNCLIWLNPDGRVVLGKPTFGQRPVGKLMLNKNKRSSNVLSMRAVYSGTKLAGRYTVLWSAIEAGAQFAFPKSRTIENTSDTAKRLLNNGHIVNKIVETSFTEAASPSGADAANRITNAQQSQSGNDFLDLFAKRQMARDNFDELLVTCVVAGHYNERGTPYAPDQVYNIEFDRAKIQENMYLYAVNYQANDKQGQFTVLNFCKLNTIAIGSKINA